MDDRFVNLGEEVILTLLWQSGASESDCNVLLLVCVFAIDCSYAEFCASCVCVCVCVRERETERERESHHSVLFANTYELHHCVCHVTLFPSRAWTDGKTKDIINCLYIYFESWNSWLWKGALHFPLQLAVFGQSQCTVPVGQSEQTALVRRRDFGLREAGHRGPTIMYSIWKIMFFLTLKHVYIFCYAKYTK